MRRQGPDVARESRAPARGDRVSDDAVESDAQGPRPARFSCSVCSGDSCLYMRGAYDSAQAEITAAYLDNYKLLHVFVTRRARQLGISEAELDREGTVQDTFMVAIRFWHDVREPRAWLFTVADRLVGRHLTRGSCRARGVYKDAQRYEAEVAEPWWTSTVAQASTSQEVAVRRVFEVLAALAERQRIATYLHHVHGLTHPDIAELLGCEPATVGVHIHRAVKSIRDDEYTAPASPARVKSLTVRRTPTSGALGRAPRCSPAQRWQAYSQGALCTAETLPPGPLLAVLVRWPRVSHCTVYGRPGGSGLRTASWTALPARRRQRRWRAMRNLASAGRSERMCWTGRSSSGPPGRLNSTRHTGLRSRPCGAQRLASRAPSPSATGTRSKRRSAARRRPTQRRRPNR
jgi:RNA polymerase sigma factor (sigma-70 family)